MLKQQGLDIIICAPIWLLLKDFTAMSDLSQFINHNGTALAYHRLAGRAPGIVFMGGYRSDMTGTKALALEEHARGMGQAFLRFDYSGHGASEGAFVDGTIGRWAADSVAMLDQQTSGPQILVGSSMGGWLMLLAALQRPERIAGLVGIAAAPDFSEDLVWARLDQTARDQIMQTGAYNQPSAYGQEAAPITRAFIEDGRKHVLLHDAIPLNCPVRLIAGMQDQAVPWQTSLKLAERLAGDDISLTLIKDGEHRLSRPADLDVMIEAVVGLG